MARTTEMSPRERLVQHVQELERLQELKDEAANNLKEGFARAAGEGYDRTTLKVVLKLRKMTPEQRRERRALEAIYMAALGMLEGDALPEVARRRLDEDSGSARDAKESPRPPKAPDRGGDDREQTAPADPPRPIEQPPLVLKEPDEARQEGAAAAATGKRIYDNPYPAGDPCRAAWDEGWCAKQQSHGMDTPAAYQRRGTAPPKDEEREKDRGSGSGDVEKGAA